MTQRIHVASIDALLPQTQCTKCGYDGCRPYAEAIVQAAAPINRCVPGGPEVVAALSQQTGQPIQPVDPSLGMTLDIRLVAYIREMECIGCTKCIQVCPVDAIIGAAGFMHTVLADDCTGCDLCVAACPVDCIDMLDSHKPRLPTPEESEHWRALHEYRLERLRLMTPLLPSSPPPNNKAKQVIAAALARTELKKFLKEFPEPSLPSEHRQWLERKRALEQSVQQAEEGISDAF